MFGYILKSRKLVMIMMVTNTEIDRKYDDEDVINDDDDTGELKFANKGSV